MSSDLVPQQGKSEFDGYKIDTSVRSIADNYTTTKMPMFQDTGPNAIFFPSKSSYSNTNGNGYIEKTSNENLFEVSNTKTELIGNNIFIVLVDPKY